MSRYATDSGGGGGFKPEFGIHNVICCQLVDMGTTDKEWEGKVIGKVNKINFGFEFVDVTKESEKGSYHPLWGQQFTNSLGKKANLRKLLDGWRGQAFTPEELKKFNLGNLLGLSCQLVIQPNGKGNPKIASIVKSSEKLVGERELHEFWVEEGCFDEDLPEWMPEWMAGDIKQCDECATGFGAKEAAYAPSEPLPNEVDDDDIPF